MPTPSLCTVRPNLSARSGEITASSSASAGMSNSWAISKCIEGAASEARILRPHRPHAQRLHGNVPLGPDDHVQDPGGLPAVLLLADRAPPREPAGEERV